jgi:hypothetical protein
MALEGDWQLPSLARLTPVFQPEERGRRSAAS